MDWLSAIVVVALAIVLWNWLFRPWLATERRERERDKLRLSREEELEVKKLARERRQRSRLSH